MNIDKSEKFWDRLAKNFDKGGEQYEQSYIETITRYLDRNDVVLDFACGTGSLSCLLAENVMSIHGIDISSNMIDIAMNKAVERKIENILFEQSTIFDEKFAEDSFDAIMACNILHLIEDSLGVIQRIYQLLKPGGIFISDTPCLGEQRALMKGFLALLSKIGIAPYINPLKISQLDDLLAKGKFQIAHSEELGNGADSYLLIAKKAYNKSSPMGSSP